MNSTDSIFRDALSKMLIEIFNGPPGQEAYVLNPGDEGLLRQLDSLDARTASSRPMPGRTTIAAHADHLRYGLSLMNRWIAGEADVWGDADWNASWDRTTVTPQEWQTLRDNLRREADAWRKVVAERTEWEGVTASAALSSAAHTAFHLGAIRQILAALRGS